MRINTTIEEEAKLREAERLVREALDALNEEVALKGKGRDELQRRQGERAARRVNLLDPESVSFAAKADAEIAYIQTRLESDTDFRAALATLETHLRGAKSAIQQCAQSRSLEEATIAMCSWMNLLDNSYLMDVPNRMHLILAVAQTVLGDIAVLLEARRGALLSNEERRVGSLRYADGRGQRPLTNAERMTGVALE